MSRVEHSFADLILIVSETHPVFSCFAGPVRPAINLSLEVGSLLFSLCLIHDYTRLYIDIHINLLNHHSVGLSCNILGSLGFIFTHLHCQVVCINSCTFRPVSN